MSKLQNEVREVVGNKTHLTEDDLIGMNYLRAVIKETLRLHPPLSIILRMSTEDVNIKGYNIKANTRVRMNVWQIGRDPMSYNKAEEFEPERFLNSRRPIDYKGNDFQLIPFGVGRRGCPGSHFAISAAEIALASLVHKFDWALPDESKPQEFDMTESIHYTNFVIRQRQKTVV
ncbi:putative psoralen synthase [Rosa chinensis]|uniref:Putative psoralen synthase n=1 Tax=Rosa chinensis TaxID=74649 RepID=A0A2P6P6U3_ROSCH|nr:putative psoralen synthase [Rosa chinensis]